jgi:hypothetical protein
MLNFGRLRVGGGGASAILGGVSGTTTTTTSTHTAARQLSLLSLPVPCGSRNLSSGVSLERGQQGEATGTNHFYCTPPLKTSGSG